MRERGSLCLQKPEPDKISDCKLRARPPTGPYSENGRGIQFDRCAHEREARDGPEWQGAGYNLSLAFLAAEEGVLVPTAEMGKSSAFEFGKSHLRGVVISGE